MIVATAMNMAIITDIYYYDYGWPIFNLSNRPWRYCLHAGPQGSSCKCCRLSWQYSTSHGMPKGTRKRSGQYTTYSAAVGLLYHYYPSFILHQKNA